MIYTLKNERLTVDVNSKGAELWSIRAADGTEYLWQGDPAYWQDRALTLFPYIGRLTEQSYTYDGKHYNMDIHGVAPYSDFLAEASTTDRLCLSLSASEETLGQYPFRFTFRVEYALRENTLAVRYTVENKDHKTMYFAVGGHPGINVPLEPGKAFEDYYLEFGEACRPDRVQFTEACFVTGEELPFLLEHDKRLPLRHEMFDDDAIVLKKIAKRVTLGCEGGTRSVTMDFHSLPILGIWHMPHTDAPYICMEPWSSLPARDGEITDLEKQRDLIALEEGKVYENHWTLNIK